MSKMIFPANGLYPNCKTNIEECDRQLRDASANCVFDTPPDFQYKNYLDRLSMEINKHRNELTEIISEIQSLDRNLSNLSDELEHSASKLTVSKINQREHAIR